MYDAARRAAIHDTIKKFPEQYSTVVGERGLKVRQLILIVIQGTLVAGVFFMALQFSSRLGWIATFNIDKFNVSSC